MKGVGSSIAIGVVGTAKADDSVEIVTEKGDDWEVTKEVPAPWYNHVQQSRNSREHLEQMLQNVAGVVGFSRAVADETIEGRRKFKLIVYAESQAEDQIPDSVGGIPVEIEEPPEEIVLDACYNDGSLDNNLLPGGHDVYGSAGHVTSCCQVTQNNRECLLTVNHAWMDCTDSIDQTLYAQDGSDYLYAGDVHDFDRSLDFALVKESGAARFDGEIELPSGGSEQVAGHITWSGLENMASNDESVTKVGIGTGKETGQIANLDRSINRAGGRFPYVEHDDALYISYDCVDGDSGGPVFADSDSSNGDVCIAGYHMAHTSGDETDRQNCNNDFIADHGFTGPAYVLANNHDVSFDV